MLKEFREFLLRGNLVEIAVGLVLALAFTAVVTSLVEDLITPLIKPVNALVARARREGPEEPGLRQCPECLSEIPVEARRCSFCTSEVASSA